LFVDGANKIMRTIATTLLLISLLSGCVVNVVNKPVQEPRLLGPTCRFVETPVYGYADLYRDGRSHIRIREVAYIDRQWRCH
jgi:hypothetical protein